MKKILSALLVLCMLLCVFSSCIKTPKNEAEESSQAESTSEVQNTTDTEHEPEGTHKTEEELQLKRTSYNLLTSKDKIHIQGRSMDTADGITADWSASGIEFKATYKGYISVTGKATKDVKFYVYVNGKETGTVTFGSSMSLKKLPGTETDEPTTATIRLVRAQYVKDGLATLKAVSLVGTIHEWQEERKLIEFIGDSITCGAGSITNDRKMDGSRTYAYVAASELEADYSLVAISGIGVNQSSDNHYGKVMGDFYKYNTHYRDETTLYTPDRKADLVVVNLNTNDDGHELVESEYKADLKALLADIHSIHGEDVNIVWIVGQMSPVDIEVNGWLFEVLDELGGEESGYYVMETTQNNAGGANHPNYASHKVTAGHLVTFIKENKLLG